MAVSSQDSFPRQSISNTRLGLWLGLFSSLAVLGILAFGYEAWGFPFVPFDLFDWLARVLPGWLIGSVITGMVVVIRALQGVLPVGSISDAAKLTEQVMALGLLVAAGGGLGAWLGRQSEREPGRLIFFGQAGGLVLLAAVLLVEIWLGSVSLAGFTMVWLALVFAGWGWGLAWLLRAATVPRAGGRMFTRREFLVVSGLGLVAAALGSWGLGRLLGTSTGLPQRAGPAEPLSADDPFGARLTSGPAASPPPEALAARSAAVPGTRAELTANDDFYRIDINTRPPRLDEADWQVQINGLVDNPLLLSLADIRNLPARTQILTMQCISNPIGGDLTSSSRWTGVPLPHLLGQVGLGASVVGAHISAADGFDEFVALDDLQDERCLLVYAMNGEPLPPEHGYPLRIYIPNRYGMKQPKWITHIEFVSQRVDGYWVRRGWDREAIPHTVSVVDTVMVDREQGPQGLVHSGGIAWAGARGISKVEVQMDNQGWEQAGLIQPELSQLTWTLWRHSWPYARGRHMISVRAYDGAGRLQELMPRNPAPSGATGIHSATVDL
ncbi:MAG: molybdopterin-dependent oxidoreductase [Anaerolineales bacterium]|nr:molybdopterin-dependent oxidoreductase [Anaerolineales bacterium]